MPANISKRQSLRHDQGFTLIEIVITIILLGAVAGIMLPFFTAITHSPDPVLRERAISLGQAMMDEIMAKKWDENTPMGGGPICTGESGEGRGNGTYILTDTDCLDPAKTASAIGLDGEEFSPVNGRGDWNDVDDYNYYDDNEEKDTFYDQNHKLFSLPGYSRKVTVRYIKSDNDSITEETDNAEGLTTDTKLVVVKITSPLGETFSFVAVACNI
jgi:prepilin-type N-terminal cleavage/methylation domain-containing protein